MVSCAAGLHLRPAAMLAGMARQFESEILIRSDRSSADCKRLVDVVMLCAGCGARVIIEAKGRDADAAVRSIGHLFEESFFEASVPDQAVT